MLIVFIRRRARIAIRVYLKRATNGDFIKVRRLLRTKRNVSVRCPNARLIRERVGTHSAQGAVPIRANLLPTANNGDGRFVKFSNGGLRTTVYRVATVRINKRVILNDPRMAKVSTCCNDPIIAALCKRTTMARDRVTLQIKFQARTLNFRRLLRLRFITNEDLQRVIKHVLIQDFYVNGRTRVNDDRFKIVLLLTVQHANGNRHNVLSECRTSSPIKVTSKRKREPLLRVTVRARNRGRFLRHLIYLLKRARLNAARRMGRVDNAIRATRYVNEVVITVVRTNAIQLREANRSQHEGATFIRPAKRKARMLRFLQYVLRGRGTNCTTLRLNIRHVCVGAISNEFKVCLVNSNVPIRHACHLFRLAYLARRILRRRVDRGRATRAVSMVISVPPTATMNGALINNIVMRNSRLLLRLIFRQHVLHVIMNSNSTFRRIRVITCLCPRSKRRVFIPVKCRAFMYLKIACRVSEASYCLTILMNGPVGVVLLASKLRLLIQGHKEYMRRTTRALLRGPCVLLLHLNRIYRESIQFPRKIFMSGRPIINNSLVCGQCLRINDLLTNVCLTNDGRVIRGRFPFRIKNCGTSFIRPFFQNTLRVTFVACPYSTPANRISTGEGENTCLTVLRRLRPGLLILNLLVMRPCSRDQGVNIFPHQIFLLGLRIFFSERYNAQLRDPTRAIITVPVVFITGTRLQADYHDSGHQGLLLLGEGRTLVLRSLYVCATQRRRTGRHCHSCFPFARLRRIYLFGIVSVYCLRVYGACIILPRPWNRVTISFTVNGQWTRGLFAVRNVDNNSVLRASFGFVPVIKLRGINNVNVLFRSKFGLYVIRSVVLSVMFARAHDSVVVATMTRVMGIRHVMVLRLTITPYATNGRIVQVPKIVNPPGAVRITRAIMTAVLGRRLCPMNGLVISHRPFLVPGKRPIQECGVRHVTSAYGFRFSKEVLRSPNNGPTKDTRLRAKRSAWRGLRRGGLWPRVSVC